LAIEIKKGLVLGMARVVGSRERGGPYTFSSFLFNEELAEWAGGGSDGSLNFSGKEQDIFNPSRKRRQKK